MLFRRQHLHQATLKQQLTIQRCEPLKILYLYKKILTIYFPNGNKELKIISLTRLYRIIKIQVMKPFRMTMFYI